MLLHEAQVLTRYGRLDEASVIYARIRTIQPNLSFSCWLKEAAMWTKQDMQKMLASVQQAKLAWVALSDRQRVSMQIDYAQLLQIENGEFE